MNSKLNTQNIMIFIFIFSFIFPMFWLPVYDDDAMRFHWGYIGLTAQGRPMTEIYYRILNGFTGRIIFDVYNLNLIISLCMLYASLLAMYNYNKMKTKYIRIASTIAIVSSPFLLQNLSYHVDVVGMIFSFSLSILSACLFNRFQAREIIISSVLIVVATLSYQASLNVFISSVALLAYCKLTRLKENDINNCFFYIIAKVNSFVIAITFVFIVNFFIATDDYVSNHSTIVGLNKDGFYNIYKNFLDIIDLVYSSFNKNQIVLMLIVFSCGLIGFIYNAISMCRTKNFYSAALCFLSVLGVFGFVFLPTIIFTDPVVRPRVLMSFGFVFALSIIASSSHRVLSAICVSSFALYSFTVLATSSVYVAAANKQFDRQSAMIRQVSSDIRYKLDNFGVAKVKFQGELTPSKLELMSMKGLPIVDSLLVPLHGAAWNLTSIIGDTNVPISVVDVFKFDGADRVLVTSDYDISQDTDGHYLVDFKKK